MHTESRHQVRIGANDGPPAAERVRLAALSAAKEEQELEVILTYSRPPRRVLDRARQVVPPELRWRVHGAMLVDQVASEVRTVAATAGARVVVRYEEHP